jgi:hypothetical protein
VANLDGSLTAMFGGLQEVPLVASNGTGTMYFRFNPATNVLSYLGVVSGLNANVTAAHIHTGTVGVSGGVLVPLSFVPTTNGAIFSGSVALAQGSVNTLLSGGYYANVHTTAVPGGEVRGQIWVGWLGMTDNLGMAPALYTSATPGAVTVHALTGAYNANTIVTFLVRLFLPVIGR